MCPETSPGDLAPCVRTGPHSIHRNADGEEWYHGRIVEDRVVEGDLPLRREGGDRRTHSPAAAPPPCRGI